MSPMEGFLAGIFITILAVIIWRLLVTALLSQKKRKKHLRRLKRHNKIMMMAKCAMNGYGGTAEKIHQEIKEADKKRRIKKLQKRLAKLEEEGKGDAGSERNNGGAETAETTETKEREDRFRMQ